MCWFVSSRIILLIWWSGSCIIGIACQLSTIDGVLEILGWFGFLKECIEFGLSPSGYVKIRRSPTKLAKGQRSGLVAWDLK